MVGAFRKKAPPAPEEDWEKARAAVWGKIAAGGGSRADRDSLRTQPVRGAALKNDVRSRDNVARSVVAGAHAGDLRGEASVERAPATRRRICVWISAKAMIMTFSVGPAGHNLKLHFW